MQAQWQFGCCYLTANTPSRAQSRRIRSTHVDPVSRTRTCPFSRKIKALSCSSFTHDAHAISVIRGVVANISLRQSVTRIVQYVNVPLLVCSTLLLSSLCPQYILPQSLSTQMGVYFTVPMSEPCSLFANNLDSLTSNSFFCQFPRSLIYSMTRRIALFGHQPPIFISCYGIFLPHLLWGPKGGACRFTFTKSFSVSFSGARLVSSRSTIQQRETFMLLKSRSHSAIIPVAAPGNT